MTNCVWSPWMKANISYGLVAASSNAGDNVVVHRANGLIAARLVELPFL